MRQASRLLPIDIDRLGERRDHPVFLDPLPAVESQLHLPVPAFVRRARREDFDHQLGGARQMACLIEAPCRRPWLTQTTSGITSWSGAKIRPGAPTASPRP